MLRAHNLNVAYGPVKALWDVSLAVEEGEIVAVLGANGAGKSTMLKTLSGLVRPTAGTVRFEGEDITRLPVEELIQRGLTHVPEGGGVIPELTVEENLRLGGLWRKGAAGTKVTAEAIDDVYDLFERLKERRSYHGHQLSGGERQMLALGRALMSDPKLLLLDEPSDGLAPSVVDVIFEKLQEINRAGISIVMVEQNARRCLQICHRGYVLDQGTNAHMRVVLICIGRKLVEVGVLDEPDDVIFLKYNELRYLLGDLENFDARRIVKERRAERKAQEKLKPRDWIGTATESQLEFPYLGVWGFPDRLYMEQEAADTVTGIAASPGVIEGQAKVVTSVDEFDEVKKGDILVCQMTNPAWTPLFALISGIVTDAGGTVSHPAVMAREFGIPAVLGCSVATARIKSGDRLRVNGSTGRVEIL